MHTLNSLPRPVHPVTIPGGGTLFVRDLSLAELRDIDRRAEHAPEGEGRGIRFIELVAVYALSSNGEPMFPARNGEDLESVAALTPAQLKAIAEAVLSSKDAAKN